MKHEVGDKVRIKAIPSHTINSEFGGEKAVIVKIDSPIFLLQLDGKDSSPVNRIHLTEEEFINISKL